MFGVNSHLSVFLSTVSQSPCDTLQKQFLPASRVSSEVFLCTSLVCFYVSFKKSMLVPYGAHTGLVFLKGCKILTFQ